MNEFKPGMRVRCKQVGDNTVPADIGIEGVVVLQDAYLIKSVQEPESVLVMWDTFDGWGVKDRMPEGPGKFWFVEPHEIEIIQDVKHPCHCERQVWLLNGCQCGGI